MIRGIRTPGCRACREGTEIVPTVAVGWLLALAPLLLAPAARGLDTVEEIRECVRGNFPERTSVQAIELASRDRAGGRRTLEARLHWKRFGDGHPRVRIRVDAPADLRGASYLVIEKEGDDELFMYLPAVQRVRRITSGMLGDQLWGTDFSYEDIRQIQGIAIEGESARLADATVAERAAYVLELRPAASEGSPYERIVSFVDRETCVALRTEFYERGETPRKVLRARVDTLDHDGSRWLARDLEMHDARDGTTSWLRVVSVEHDAEIPDKIFNPTLLARGR